MNTFNFRKNIMINMMCMCLMGMCCFDALSDKKF